MKKTDDTNWTRVLVEVSPGYLIADRTLQSREEFEEFCNDHGYKIIKWEQGTDPRCSH